MNHKFNSQKLTRALERMLIYKFLNLTEELDVEI